VLTAALTTLTRVAHQGTGDEAPLSPLLAELAKHLAPIGVGAAFVPAGAGEADQVTGYHSPVSLDGRTFGTLVVTGAPDGDARVLIDHTAVLAAGILERERLSSEYAELLSLAERVEHTSNVGCWIYEIETGDLFWSTQTRRIHEVDAGYTPTVEEAIEFYAPEAREAITQAFVAAVQDGTEAELDLPLITAKGNMIWANARLRAEKENGHVKRVFGTFQDITAKTQLINRLSSNEQRLQLANEVAGAVVFEVDMVDWRIIDAERSVPMFGREITIAFRPVAALLRKWDSVLQKWDRHNPVRHGIWSLLYPPACGRVGRRSGRGG
jgi:PAS domain-containing protein